MNLQELKRKTPPELLAFAEELEVENASSLRKQDMMFAILKTLADKDQAIFGDGVLEVLQDGFGFLRSPEGEFTTFGAPGAGTGSYQGTGCNSDCPVRLNNSGAITRVYIDANSVYHGYLRSPDGKITTIDPKGSFLTFSSGMNDADAITGYYLDGNNVFHDFLRTSD